MTRRGREGLRNCVTRELTALGVDKTLGERAQWQVVSLLEQIRVSMIANE